MDLKSRNQKDQEKEFALELIFISTCIWYSRFHNHSPSSWRSPGHDTAAGGEGAAESGCNTSFWKGMSHLTVKYNNAKQSEKMLKVY